MVLAVHYDDRVTPARSCSAPVGHWPVPAPPVPGVLESRGAARKAERFPRRRPSQGRSPKDDGAGIHQVPHGVAPVEGIAEVALGSSRRNPTAAPREQSSFIWWDVGTAPATEPSQRQRAAGEQPAGAEDSQVSQESRTAHVHTTIGQGAIEMSGDQRAESGESNGANSSHMPFDNVWNSITKPNRALSERRLGPGSGACGSGQSGSVLVQVPKSPHLFHLVHLIDGSTIIRDPPHPLVLTCIQLLLGFSLNRAAIRLILSSCALPPFTRFSLR